MPVSAARQNPFVVGNSVGGTEVFVGREDIIRRVEATLLQPLEPGLVLFGQRRVGKTSILQELEVRLRREARWIPVFFDLQGRAQASVDLIIRDLAGAIARECGQAEPSFGPTVSEEFRSVWLPRLLSGLPTGARVVLLLDEFDVVADPKAPLSNQPLFEFLRGIFDGEHRGQLAAVYAMGRTMEDLDISAGPLFRGLRTEHVSTLCRQDFDALLAKGTEDGALTWDPEATEQTWSLTRGHAMLTQLLASYAWQAAWERPGRRIEARHIRDTVPKVLQESRSIVGWLWLGLTPACRVVASALAEHGSAAVSMDEMERLLRQSGVRIMMGQLTEAPERLCEWDLLENDNARPPRFRFKVEMLRQWIVKYQPFSKAREYLDRLNPDAHDDYLRALDRWNSSKSAEDIRAVVRLLDLVLNDTRGNPNHVGATELLAEVYLSQDRLDEAIQIVERLLPSQTAALRPRYTQLLLLKAEGLHGEETEEQRLQIYGRILEVAPGTADAEAERHAIWRERGRRALAAGKLEVALADFERAGSEAEIAETQSLIDHQRCAAVLERVKGMEAALQYDGAVEEITSHLALIRRVMGGAAEALLVRLAQEQEKVHLYHLASEATDPKRAIDSLRQVVYADPYYRDAARRLATLVSQERGRRLPAWTRPTLNTMFVVLLSVLVVDAYKGVRPEPAPTRREQPAAAVRQSPPVVAAPGVSEPEPPAGESAEEVEAWDTGELGPVTPLPAVKVDAEVPVRPNREPRRPKRPEAPVVTLASQAAALAPWINSICKIALEDAASKATLGVTFTIDVESGALVGAALTSWTGELADRSCIARNATELVRILDFAKVPIERRAGTFKAEYTLTRGQ